MIKAWEYEYDPATWHLLENVIEDKVRAVLLRGGQWRWVEKGTFELHGPLFLFVDGDDDVPTATIHGRVTDLIAVKQMI